LQITNFNPLRRDNTDGILDLLAYAPRVPELYSEFISSQYEAVVQEGSQHEVVDAIENCPF
jgi:hypothetical protein